MSLFDQICAHDPLLAVQVRTRIEKLAQRIQDLEAQSCNQHEAIIESLTIKLAAAQRKITEQRAQ
mgnify:CR=1 FL=1|tara:strand:+ start:1041 stop:1235 length:195 start_codon:yes stop_codon:yes gene_type:complete